MSRTVEVRVAGQNYRVVSSAPEEEVRRLAGAVNAKLAEIVPKGRVAPPNALLLAAIALAHEVEAEREKRESLERRAGDLLRRTVARIDAVLESPDGAPDEANAEGRNGGGGGGAGERGERSDDAEVRVGDGAGDESGDGDGGDRADGARADGDGGDRGDGAGDDSAEAHVEGRRGQARSGPMERAAGRGEVSRET